MRSGFGGAGNGELGKVAEVGDVTEAGRGGSGMAGGGDGSVVTEVLLRRLEAEEAERSGPCMLSRICDYGDVSRCKLSKEGWHTCSCSTWFCEASSCFSRVVIVALTWPELA